MIQTERIYAKLSADRIDHSKPNDLNTGAANEDAIATAPMMK
ncbi:MAG: hypothetical protein ACREV2_06820 [Burkholderiales bacterium]